jgi:diadenosine tetraphosphate (Ap4A) HIT family hydrolase
MLLCGMNDQLWNSLVLGTDCPLCVPRPDHSGQWDLVAALSVSSLYLSKNQTYRGHCQLIFDSRHVSRPDQLSPDEWGMFCADLHRAESVIMQTVHADHVNVESLGNVVPHLHWHIIPRYRNDPRWGAPVWTTALSDMPETTLASKERQTLLQAIRTSFCKAADAI